MEITRNFRPYHRRKRAFSLIEICISVAIIAVLITITTPAILAMRERYHAAQSITNLRECLTFLRNISNDANGALTLQNTNSSWIQLFWNNAYPGRSFPAWEADASNLRGTFFYDPGVSYDIARGFSPVRTFAINLQPSQPTTGNGAIIRWSVAERPSVTALLATVGSPNRVSSNLMRSQINFRFRKATLAHVGFMDGHVQPMTPKDLEIPLNTYEDVFWKGKP